MDYLWLRIVGTVIFFTGLFFFLRYAWRKDERDWEARKKSNAEHAEWMVNQGRSMERYEAKRKGDSSVPLLRPVPPRPQPNSK